MYELQSADGSVYTRKLPITFLVSEVCGDEYLSMVAAKPDESHTEKAQAEAFAKAMAVGVKSAREYRLPDAKSLEKDIPPFSSKQSENVSVASHGGGHGGNNAEDAALKVPSFVTKDAADDRFTRELESAALNSIKSFTSTQSFPTDNDIILTRDPSIRYAVYHPKSTITTSPPTLGIIWIDTLESSAYFRPEDFISFIRDALLDLSDRVDAILFDLRGVRGGDGFLAEALTQLMHYEVEQLTMRIRNSEFNRGWVRGVEDNSGERIWEGDLLRAAENGSYYTPDVPRFSLESITTYGQATNKPIGVYVNGACYGVCEQFAAVLQDSGAALIIGEDRKTGGGGGTVLNYNAVASHYASIPRPENEPPPFRMLPYGQDLFFAVGQLLRKGKRHIENAGVDVDVYVRKTIEDVLEGGTSYYDRIADILVQYGNQTGRSDVVVDVHPREMPRFINADENPTFTVLAAGVDAIELLDNGNVITWSNLTLSKAITNVTFTIDSLAEGTDSFHRLDFIAKTQGAVKFRTTRYLSYSDSGEITR
ncbi:hypothetical protein HK102_001860 [Quaeritorhiza haematococci]|nr:hypothetical protein HK102_001860 [Quaeritorhiza haematococci]